MLALVISGLPPTQTKNEPESAWVYELSLENVGKIIIWVVVVTK